MLARAFSAAYSIPQVKRLLWRVSYDFLARRTRTHA
jgi:hypothetical protein